jgi:hypothetical protein
VRKQVKINKDIMELKGIRGMDEESGRRMRSIKRKE